MKITHFLGGICLVMSMWTLSGTTYAGTIDMEKVQQAWLVMHNDLRSSMKLAPYSLHTGLSTTALEWSQLAQTRGEITHKRAVGDAYYDYKKIERWFAKRGIHFKNVSRATYSESIGWGSYRCKSDDCTQALIEATRATYRFFYSEKAKNGPHYKAMTHPRFKVMGVGVVVDEAKGRYYLTVHYGTEVIKK